MANFIDIPYTLRLVFFSFTEEHSIMFFYAISPLFNKSEKGSSRRKNKQVITPVAVYSGDRMKLAVIENKGKSGIYR